VKGFAKIIAIKKILPHLAEDAHFVDMFVAEAKMAVQLNHASICQILELGKQGDDHYIAMEYISGKDLLSLHNHFRRTGTLLPVDLTAYIGARVAEGLDYAHRKRGPDGEPIGIVHRDVSPQNVLVSYDGAVKLIDFGIAKARVRMYEETQAGVLKGKFGYMSPEQVGAGEVDHRSDIFALGTVVHELLTSHRLFLGETDFGTLEQVRQARVAPPSQLNPDVPPELDRILLKALARDPEQRYQSAAEMADDLGRFLHSRGEAYSTKPLADWMHATFAEDIQKEKARHEIYAEIDSLPPEPSQLPTDGDDDDEEETALWEPVAYDDEPVPLVVVKRTAPDRPRIGAVATRIAEEPTPIAAPLSAVPTPLPVLAPPLIAPRRRPSRRDIVVLAVLVTLALAGGVVAYLALDPAHRATTGTAGFVLRVTPEDELSVYLDHQVIAERSPVVKRDLAPGAYVLRIDRPGHETWRQTLKLEAGEIAEVDAHLRAVEVPPARLRVETNPPDAELEINGRVYSPAERQGYLEVDGTRPVQLTARREGYLPQTQTFTPEPGVSRSLTVALVPTRGSLFVDSDPPGDVYLDGKRVGTTPRTLDELDAGRPWPLRIERPGYKPVEETVRFGDRRFVQIERKLEPAR
jgi:hypothetical protein